ncbi:unnamed protein product [Bursaphelenchus okinawaensis]|uniref:Uncharacterized protein n=1 Tax=Bursaphelenchus okinawaensis TaxID=465554 RepID=A0A811LNT3_9BILA|nr:unnamed protein product [Bursaphelenchus okinawaensis]CAG9124950.1 unnamed protein product [Bursaphelenchus okinawaensis]
MELWQQCVKWLRATGVLQDFIKFEKLEAFAYFLKDGILLCRLAQRLDENSIDECQIPNNATCDSEFISASNIARFLRICKENFGLSDAELFDEADLYELGDFRRVLHVLSLLSWSNNSRGLGLTPFPQTEPPNRNTLNLSHEEEDLYTELRHRADQVNDEVQAIRQNYRALNGIKQQRDEQLYSSFVEKKRAISTFKPTNKREFYMKELLDTENNYCDTLAMILHNYYEPMSKFVLDEDMKKIFINMKDLLPLHQDFLKYLEPAVMHSLNLEVPTSFIDANENRNITVGDVFLAFKTRFVIYGEYCSYMDSGREHILKLIKENPQFNRMLSECDKNSEQNQFKLWDLISVPMQRILKYHVVLKAIFDSTEISHPEHKPVEDAYEGMKDVSDYINEAKRDFETMFFFNELMQKVQYECNYIAFGRPIQDGQIKVYDPKVSDSTKQRHVFLFERMIMFCKIGKNEKYEFRSQYALSDLQMADEDQSNRNSTLPRKLTQTIFDNRNSFMLVFRSQLPTGTVPATEPPGYIQFIFKTEAQRDQWKKNFEKALDISEPRQAVEKQHKVYYKTYKEAATCDACKKLLNGLFLQGYCCKVCNQNLHYNCLGLQVCAGNRPKPRLRMSHSSFNGTLNNNIPPRYMSGELVQAVQSIASPDSAVLSFQKDDMIEVVQENFDGTITGRLVRSPTKVGVIRRDSVRRVLTNPGFTPTGSQSSLVQRRSSFNHLTQVDNLPAGRLQPRRSTHDRISASSTCEHLNMPLISDGVLEYHCPSESDRPIKDYPWYFSNLSRDEAQNYLENQPNGTFLVRWSESQLMYALSVAYGGQAKHMRIEYDQAKSMFYLHDSMFFHNVPSLIKCYRTKDLSEGFKNMSGTLTATPLRTTRFRVVHAYQHAAENNKYLSMEANEVINVLDTSGEQNGWWKGRANLLEG